MSERLRDTTLYTSDLILPNDEDGEEFRSLLAGYLVRAFHATRLLPHEVVDVRQQGLIPLSQGLVRQRLKAARQAGYLTDPEVEDLLAGSVASKRNRAGQVCLFLADEPLQGYASGVWHLLTKWGGEGIYWGRRAMWERLRTLGTPTIVEAAVDLSDGWRTHLVSPELAKAFIGRFLELEGRGASVHYRAPVPPNQILDFWQPGRSEYDRYEGLPQE